MPEGAAVLLDKHAGGPHLCCVGLVLLYRLEGEANMANPFVRMMVNLVVMGAGVFSRAFVAAYQQAVQSTDETPLCTGT